MEQNGEEITENKDTKKITFWMTNFVILETYKCYCKNESEENRR